MHFTGVGAYALVVLHRCHRHEAKIVQGCTVTGACSHRTGLHSKVQETKSALGAAASRLPADRFAPFLKTDVGPFFPLFDLGTTSFGIEVDQ